tara:strand:+ start:1153 stop:2379 length:1227 start_codon:yes stop_codon:yes gene_type:complete
MIEGWKKGVLSDFVELIHGYQFRSIDFTEEGIPVIKISNVIGAQLDLSDLSYIDASRLSDFKKYLLKEGDVLMSLTGNIGRVVMVKNIDKPFLQNYRVGKFVPINSKDILKSYIKYLLSSDLVLNQLFKFANQSAQANFGKQDMNKLKVVIPNSLPEQQKIAEILSTVDAKIENIEKQIKETEQLKKGMMQRLLTQGIGHTEFKDTPLGRIPKSWEVKKLGSFAKVYAGGTPKTSNLKYWGGSIRWMSSGEVNKRFIDEVEGRITDLGLNESSARLVPPRSILMALAGQGKTRGKVAINHVELTTNQSLAAITNLQDVDVDFLFQNLESRYHEIRRMSTGDGGRGGLNLKIINSIKVPIPETEEQLKISKVIKRVDDKITSLLLKVEAYGKLKMGLMQKLLTGQIRVT